MQLDSSKVVECESSKSFGIYRIDRLTLILPKKYNQPFLYAANNSDEFYREL